KGKITIGGHLGKNITENKHEDNLKTKIEITSKKCDLPVEIKEHRSTGDTTGKIYSNYCRAGGKWFYTCGLLLLLVLNQFIGSTADYFVAFWVNLQQYPIETNDKIKSNCLYIYTVLVMLLFLVSFITIWIFVKYCMNASTNLHNEMLAKVIRATMTFFQNHSSGRILNRFSKDVGTVDEVIPLMLTDTITLCLMFVGTILLISVLNYWLIIPAIVMLVIFSSFGLVFHPSYKKIKRIEGIIRSPVFSHLAASIRGLITIRVFNAQKILEQEFDNLQDRHTSAFYLLLALYSTLGYWVDMICIIYTGLIFVEVYVGAIGLAIIQSTALIGIIQFGIKSWSDLDTQMTSVERILEYIELAPEADNGTHTPLESWPNEGNVTFHSVTMCYSPKGPSVLQEVSFRINAGEKIGIVGRTGAGKTSIISALFHLFPFEGEIVIDGINTKTIPLEHLHEATANVDLKTDELIQSSIRRNFKECTILTIAHRLNTVMDSDKILVLDNGKIVEFDDPQTLLKNPNGRFYKYFNEDFTEDDLYTTLKQHKSKLIGDKAEELWQEEENFCENPSLCRVLVKMFGLEFMMYGLILSLAEFSFITLQPFFLKKLLDYSTPKQVEIDKHQAYWYATGILLLALFRVLIIHSCRLQLSVSGMKVRIACTSLIYRKLLRLKHDSFQKITLGQIVNLLSNDIAKFDFVFPYLHYIWIGLIQMFIAAYYLDVFLGHAATTGLGIIVMCMLLQVYLSKKVSLIRMQVVLKTDFRIRLVNDVISNIKIIKMNTWEKPFAKLIEAARRTEIDQVKKTSYLRIITNAFVSAMNRMSLFLSILISVLADLRLTTQYVFVNASVYEILKISVGILSRVVIACSEAKISLQRVQEFLTIDRKKQKISKKTRRSNKIGCILKLNKNLQMKVAGIHLKNVSAKWNESLPTDTLHDITFDALVGELIGVVGAAGSGKSCLLQLILKEIEPMKGTLEVEGSLSYASQEAWIFSASVRQNILFGQDLDEEKYQKVIGVCALEHDLSLFPHGDRTLVGERGVMLSGGQKARIGLARAVYRDADFYLLDDPLSAVDVYVANKIFNECILGYLGSKCVVLVTHQIQFLQNVKKIYTLEKGKITIGENLGKNIIRKKHKDTLKAKVEATLQKCDLPVEIKEHRSVGGTNRKIYSNYCRAGGNWCYTCGILLLFVVNQFIGSGTDYFLAYWVNLEHQVEANDKIKSYSLYIYTVLVILFILVSFVTIWTYVKYCMNASTNLHNEMLAKVIRATVTFFHNHSSGRILNRFSKDIGIVDEVIPLMLTDTITLCLTLIGTILLISVLNYWLIIPAIVMLVIFYSYGLVCQPSFKNIKRTEGITRSPVFSHLAASIQGLATVRAFNAQKILEQEFDNLQDLHTSAFYLLLSLQATLGYWVDITCIIYTGLVIFSFFLLENQIYVGDIGLAIVQSTALIGTIQFGIKSWCDMDTQMNSVERILEYTELAPEADNGSDIPPKSWPNEENITFRSVTMCYSPEGPSVLQEVSFRINAGEKIGIVGRTGAGKTSIISALFRLFSFEGEIVIDGINIKTIPLEHLRSKISIITQEPVLFLGTIRKNLDPFDEFNDLQLWNALEEVELKSMVSNLPLGLESVVAEGGSNFSVGQKQLLCLVRIMLKKNKIVVLDEATANVDLKTDKLIQSAIRRKFKECTVLTVAHRLNTVMDSNKIMVMDDGNIVEFDDPQTLLKNQSGRFYKYYNEVGNNR
ncbi:ABC tran domain containing protein, partial [Asbolus verrucosus]